MVWTSQGPRPSSANATRNLIRMDNDRFGIDPRSRTMSWLKKKLPVGCPGGNGRPHLSIALVTRATAGLRDA